MATVVYRPELENPPRDSSIAFSIDDSSNTRLLKTVTLNSGVNREISNEDWDIIKQTPICKALVKIRAIEEVAGSVRADAAPVAPDLAEVLSLEVVEAYKVIEASMETDFLSRWRKADGRVTIKNKITKRLLSLNAGEG